EGPHSGLPEISTKGPIEPHGPMPCPKVLVDARNRRSQKKLHQSTTSVHPTERERGGTSGPDHVQGCQERADSAHQDKQEPALGQADREGRKPPVRHDLQGGKKTP